MPRRRSWRRTPDVELLASAPSHIEVVATRRVGPPPLEQPLREWFVDPGGAFGRKPRRALRGREERGLDDDPVRIFDAQLPLVLHRPMHLGPERPPEVDGRGAHLVDRAFPTGHAQARLLLDLAGQPGEERRVGGVNDSTRRAPVGPSAAPPIPDEEHAVGRFDERARNEPLPHAGEDTGRCPPYDPTVPDDELDTPSPDRGTPDPSISRDAPPQMPSRTAFLLAFTAVVVAGLFGGIIGYGLADVGCTGDCEGTKLIGTLLGSTIAAGGVGIVAVLVLRAMAEWKPKASR